MSAQDVGNAQETLDAKFEGTELTVAFNPVFLRDGVDAVDTTEVALETIDPLKPATLARGRRRRLPVPADAGAHVLSPDARPSRRPPPRVGRFWLTDFRCFADVDLELAPGLTVLRGANGQGKTSVLEAIGWVARARSFRGVADALLVRTGAEQAIVRAEVVTGDRDAAVRSRDPRRRPQPHPVQQADRSRARAICTGCCASRVFAPDDLALVKDGPAERRDVPRRAARDARGALRRGPRPTSNGC